METVNLKKWVNYFVLIIVILVLTGCTKAGGGTEDGVEELTIMLDWYPNAVHTALYVADEKGYFEEAGLRINIEMPADTNDPLKLAATGKVDLAISYLTETIVAKSENIPIVSVASLVQHSLDGIMYKAESGMKSPKDLEGKVVGYPSSSVSETMIETMVENAGGDIGKVQLVDVGWDLMPALSTDRVDAIAGAYINHELVLLNREGYGVEIFDPAEYGVPNTYELIVVTGEETLAEKEESFVKFWQAVTKAHEEIKGNPAAGLQVLLDHENESFPLEQEVELESLNILLPLMESPNLPFGFQEEEMWLNAIDWLYEREIIKEKIDPNEHFENIVKQ